MPIGLRVTRRSIALPFKGKVISEKTNRSARMQKHNARHLRNALCAPDRSTLLPLWRNIQVKKNSLKGCKHFNGFNAAFGWQPISFAHNPYWPSRLAFYDTYTAQFFRRLDSKSKTICSCFGWGARVPTREADIGIHRKDRSQALPEYPKILSHAPTPILRFISLVEKAIQTHNSHIQATCGV